ncbi:hypothetical protein [Amycolatopsis jiangsuensis]|uniref:ABC-2 type transport system permease protein n=1 Tax=Amycolatopsis jiangsuensis TaxID=1181879 RepID=A0A840J4N4_9PSEU|nr:hypothetical protein [Amycolatopsis jiangsuensis]MBB4688304.1 hypothetical protein [Amycolatopsis jiangsuensis]
MRWLGLYARSRYVPVAVAAVPLSIVLLWWLGESFWVPEFAVLTLTMAIAIAAIGLGGQDVDLDRTAGFGWLSRRLAHLLLIGVLAGLALLAVQQLGDVRVDVSMVVRDGAGLLGLAGVAAVLFGGQFGWTLPLGMAVIALSTPEGLTVNDVMRWPMMSTDDALSWWLAGALFVLGTGWYTVTGARR